jgi:hypothetical protein
MNINDLTEAYMNVRKAREVLSASFKQQDDTAQSRYASHRTRDA